MALNSSVQTEKIDDSSNSREDLKAQYTENLITGKKNLLCGNYPDAVVCFQTACALQSEQFGETAPECAEVFFYYGKALLELARQENTVLGNALQSVPEQEVSDSDDETTDTPANIPGIAKILREATDRFICTGQFKKTEPKSQRRLFGIKEESESNGAGDATDIAGKSDGEEQTSKSENSTEASEHSKTNGDSKKDVDAPSTSGSAASSSGDKEEDPDDIPNMQLAWEMLELAKVLYSKKPKSDDNTLMIAQCCLKLGELGLEIENYSQSVGDFLECLSLYKPLLAEHDRRFAEIHYSLGLAYNFDKHYNQCIDHYKAAHSVLEKRIEHLKEKSSSSSSEESEQERKSEIDEIKELIPDITSKIEDVLIAKRQESRIAALSSSSLGFEPGTSSKSSSSTVNVIPIRKAGSGTSSETSATDISHLVRKKRKSDETASSKSTEEISSKKLKLSPKNDVANK